MLIKKLIIQSAYFLFFLCLMTIVSFAKNGLNEFNSSIDKQLSYSINQLSKLNQSGNLVERFDKLVLIGDLYLKKNDYSRSKKYYSQAKSIVESKDFDRIGKSLLKLSIVHYKEGSMKDALESALLADNSTKNSVDYHQIIQIKSFISNLFTIYLDYKKSLEYAQTAQKLLTKVKDKAQKYTVYHQLATSYERLEKFTESEKAYFEALKYVEKEPYLNNLEGLMCGLGSMYINSQKDSLAVLYLTKAINLLELESDLTRDNLLLSDCYYNLSIAKMNLELFPESEKYIRKSIQISESMKSKSGKDFLFEQYGLLKFNQENLKEAIVMFDKALRIAIDNQNINSVASIYKYLALVYEKMGDKKKTILYQKNAKDFLEKTNLENKKDSIELDKNRKEAELRVSGLINKNNDSEKSRLSNLKFIIILLLSTIFLLSLIGLLIYFIKKRKSLVSKNQNFNSNEEMTMAQPPSNFQYNVSGHILSWSPSIDGDEYYIEFCIFGTIDWTNIYTGSETNCNHLFAIGKYLVRGKSKKSGSVWGVFCSPEVIKVV